MQKCEDVDRPSPARTVHFVERNEPGESSSWLAALHSPSSWSRPLSYTAFPGSRRPGQISSVSRSLRLHASSGFLRLERPGTWDISVVSALCLFV